MSDFLAFVECAGCGESFPVRNQHALNRAKWCSERCRKQTLYSGRCEQCGGLTNGYNGPGTAAKICQTCLSWTDEELIAAIQLWVAKHDGIPPREVDFRAHGEYPSSTTVRRQIGWNEALIRAGFDTQLHCDRRPERAEHIIEQARAGRTVGEIADELGTSEANIRQRLRYRGILVRRGLAIFSEVVVDSTGDAA